MDRLDKENKVLKYKQLEHVNELTKQSEAHKEELKRETGSLRDELRDARKRVADLEKSEVALVKERDGLMQEVAALKAEKETLVAEATVEGQVTFMKSFMRQLPDFDWGQLGPDTRDYAEELRLEMEADAAKLAAGSGHDQSSNAQNEP